MLRFILNIDMIVYIFPAFNHRNAFHLFSVKTYAEGTGKTPITGTKNSAASKCKIIIV